MQKRIGFFGFGRQPAGKGTPLANPVYGLGLRGGGVLAIELDQEADAITFSSRVSADADRNGVNPAAAIQTRLWPSSAGLLLYAALGAINTTGAGPYTHTVTPAADVPYLTLFGRLDSEYHNIEDAKLDQLTISWSERRAVEVEATFKGLEANLYTASWTPTNDEVGLTRFIPPGGVFQLDGKDATPADAPITGGRITINNGLVGVPLSKSVFPDDVVPAEQVLECSFTLMPANTTLWREAITGASAGTTPSAQPIYGSFSVRFEIDANTHLTIAGSRVGFTPEYPEVDPAGGPVELEMPGRIYKPAGDALTATLVNATASY